MYNHSLDHNEALMLKQCNDVTIISRTYMHVFDVDVQTLTKFHYS